MNYQFIFLAVVIVAAVSLFVLFNPLPMEETTTQTPADTSDTMETETTEAIEEDAMEETTSGATEITIETPSEETTETEPEVMEEELDFESYFDQIFASCDVGDTSDYIQTNYYYITEISYTNDGFIIKDVHDRTGDFWYTLWPTGIQLEPLNDYGNE